MPDPSSRITLTGRYACVPNPCTTQPCLPGLAYALQAGATCFLLTESGRWFAQERAWAGWWPALGDAIAVTGVVSEHHDLRGEPFRTIEVEALVRGG